MKNIQKQILITEADVVGNKGAIAMVNCIIKELGKNNPQLKFVVTSKYIKSGTRIIDKKYPVEILYDGEQSFDIPLIKCWIYWFFSGFGLKLKFLLKDKVLKSYIESDIILSTSGISFIDNYGLIPLYHFTKYLQIGLLLKKPVIKFTQSIGPFDSWYNKTIAKLILPYLDYIIARGRNSKENLEKLNITKNVICLPDIALTLEPHQTVKTKETIDKFKGKKIIGISPNRVCVLHDKHNVYIKSLINLCEKILEEYQDTVLLFIPHTISEKGLNIEDDLKLCQSISENLNSERFFIENTSEYTPEEIKWLISQTEFFIGSRFHSLIAALSENVPSIAIGWHWKYEEMMEWLKLKDNVVQVWDLYKTDLNALFENNYNQKEIIRNHLLEKNNSLKNEALKVYDLIKEILNEKK